MDRRTILGLAAFVVASSVATRAGATRYEDGLQEAPAAPKERLPFGTRIAVRTGFAVPAGESFASSGPIADTVAGYVPLRLDLGYRLADHFYFGVTGQLAAVVPNACPSGTSCSGTNVRLGGMLAYHLRPSGAFDPWLGLGIAYEQLSTSRSVGDEHVDVSARGLELFGLELGADYRANNALRLGPVVSSSVGRFTRVDVNGASSDFDPSVHAWVMLGLRAAYDL
jgi:hypothetical protein